MEQFTPVRSNGDESELAKFVDVDLPINFVSPKEV